MKNFNFLIVILIFSSCSKVEYEKNEIRDECATLTSVEPYLVGKWQLTTRQCNHTNSINCAPVGGNWYDVNVFPSNYIIEILANGRINILKDNVKIQSSLATNWDFNGINSGSLAVNCGQNKFRFTTLNSSDSLQYANIGSTLRITNQFIDLNFENYPVVSKCVRQHYIKIE